MHDVLWGWYSDCHDVEQVSSTVLSTSLCQDIQKSMPITCYDNESNKVLKSAVNYFLLLSLNGQNPMH